VHTFLWFSKSCFDRTTLAFLNLHEIPQSANSRGRQRDTMSEGFLSNESQQYHASSKRKHEKQSFRPTYRVGFVKAGSVFKLPG